MEKENKVFGIGFHKTGTTSLAQALEVLGYKTVHGDGKNSPLHEGTEGRMLINDYIKKGDYELPTFDIYDAFTDNPYFSIWREITEIYPEAKYILTIRNEDEWIDSCVRYLSGRRVRPMRKWKFGKHANPAKNSASKKRWLEEYRKHNEEIINYFEKHNKDLLVMDITKGDGWEKLCPFLGKEMPDTSFPHKNETSSSFVEKIKGIFQ